MTHRILCFEALLPIQQAREHLVYRDHYHPHTLSGVSKRLNVLLSK